MRAARDPMNSVDGFRRPLHTTYRGGDANPAIHWFFAAQAPV